MNEREHMVPEIDPVEEELVAYLDEELEPDHRARVEHRLAEDSHYRDKLRHMQKSWDMLDLLARSEPDENFAHTTVAMVALKAKEATDVQKENTQRFSLMFQIGVAVSTLACALIAYSVMSWLLALPDRELVADLPLIERLDEYSHAESVDFLRALAEHGLFLPEAPDGNEEAALPPADVPPVPPNPETPEQRRERLKGMSPEQIATIRDRKERFEALSPEQREKIRKLAAKIDADPQADKLNHVLTAYHEWFKSLDANVQSVILAAPEDQRIPVIKKTQNELATERLQRMAVGASPQDIAAISFWLEFYVDQHEQEFDKLTPQEFRAGMAKLPKHERIRAYVWGIYWRLGRKLPLPEPTVQELDTLISVLSPQAKLILEDAESHDEAWQFAQAFIFAVQQSKRYPRLSDEELKKFADELTREQRDALEKAMENKSPDEFKNALRDLYYRQKASPPGGFYPWETGQGPPPRRPPPSGNPPPRNSGPKKID